MAAPKGRVSKKYLKSLNGWPVVSLSEVKPEPEDYPLYVIGNGFDLMHGAKSSYYDFGKTIEKNSPLRFYLEQYLKVDDLWADFEGALAKINVALMSSPYVVDTFLDAMGAYDADAGAADFFAATEMAASPIMAMSTDLMTRFRGWVCRLTTNTNLLPPCGILCARTLAHIDPRRYRVKTMYFVPYFSGAPITQE